MKNIKIITVYGSYNHGSFLQAKCLYPLDFQLLQVFFVIFSAKSEISVYHHSQGYFNPGKAFIKLFQDGKIL